MYETFLKQIKEFPRLSQEEIESLYRQEGINYEKKVKTDKNIYLFKSIAKDRETKQYIKRPSRELRNQIVCGNLGLALYMARKYYYISNKKIELDDLVQMSFEALISAAHYYRPGGKAKFSTYASKCIENKLKSNIWKKKRKRYSGDKLFQLEYKRIAHFKTYLESFGSFYDDNGKMKCDSGFFSSYLYRKKLMNIIREYTWMVILLVLYLGILNYFILLKVICRMFLLTKRIKE